MISVSSFICVIFLALNVEQLQGLSIQELHSTLYKDHAVNANRPVFIKCKPEHPIYLKENQAVHTFVTQVEAVDQDLELAGEILYSIAEPLQKEFEINPSSGSIYTAKVFDRDEPSFERFKYITIIASDRGKPALETQCSLLIEIVDVNDNTPVFQQSKYEVFVPLDAEPGPYIRTTATDIDYKENALLIYTIKPAEPNDYGLFDIENNSGIIKLKRPLTEKAEGDRMVFRVTATDNGTPPLSSEVDVVIHVTAPSRSKPPTVISQPVVITIPEDFTEYHLPVAKIEAVSNMDDPFLTFEQVQGNTLTTNSDETFRLVQNGSTAELYLSKPLDYETVSGFSLEVAVTNRAGLSSGITLEIRITDVNDDSPVFAPFERGNVLEHSPPGTFVMQIEAFDEDGTSLYSNFRYSLANLNDIFAVDATNGQITTLQELDRETASSYALTVLAYQDSDDSNRNFSNKTFFVDVLDVNDNPPYFPQPEVEIKVIENSQIGSTVGRITALDTDSNSRMVYTITEGNIREAFDIDPTTGSLKVKNTLDYETRNIYVLVVKVFDGTFESTVIVDVHILNVNDSPPRFSDPSPRIPPILEETTYLDPIYQFSAEDPEYDPQSKKMAKISYSLRGPNSGAFRINHLGELTVVRPLDRDPPHGTKTQTLEVVAHSELDGFRAESSIEVQITLEDINDNAPFLDMVQPIIWDENQLPGTIAILNIADPDETQNGAPFSVRISEDAELDIHEAFEIVQDAFGLWSLKALKDFDRETRKEYAVPVVIADSGHPQQTGTSTVTVIIGDVNDNAMSDATSLVQIYRYSSFQEDVMIGRAFTEDPDDWDLHRKLYHGVVIPEQFVLNETNGSIFMNQNCSSGSYELIIEVDDSSRPDDRATAVVNVQVEDITKDAVKNSGSLRIANLTEDVFITWTPQRKSRLEILKQKLAEIFEVNFEEVHVFSIMNWKNSRGVDVRYSISSLARDDSAKVNGIASLKQAELTASLKADVSFGTEKCKKTRNCWGTCDNELRISGKTHKIYNNRSSFIGIDVEVTSKYSCYGLNRFRESILETRERNNECRDPETDLAKCSETNIYLNENSWAWYNPLPSTTHGTMKISILPSDLNGLILFSGPYESSGVSTKDFFALELVQGFPVAYFNVGSTRKRLMLQSKSKSPLYDSKYHDIEFSWDPDRILLKMDDCEDDSRCMASIKTRESENYLKSYEVLHVGASKHWNSSLGFHGCIRELSFNGQAYNLSKPLLSAQLSFGCKVLHKIEGRRVGLSLGLSVLVVCIVICVTAAIYTYYKRRHSRRKYESVDVISQ